MDGCASSGIRRSREEHLISWDAGRALSGLAQAAAPRAQGNADYVAHFFRRGADLIGRPRDVRAHRDQHHRAGRHSRDWAAGDRSRRRGDLRSDTRHLTWPGEAAVTVSVVHVAVGSARRRCRPRPRWRRVAAINSRLRRWSRAQIRKSMLANATRQLSGSYVLYGMGFVLTNLTSARRPRAGKSRRNEERIFPYLGGEEVNSHPTQDFERYVINFGDMTLEEAGRFGELLAIVRDQVKPERDRLRDNADGRKYKQSWWQFGRNDSPALQSALATRDRCFVDRAGYEAPVLLFSAHWPSLLSEAVRVSV